MITVVDWFHNAWYLPQTRPMGLPGRTADQLGWCQGGLSGGSRMAVPWSVWLSVSQTIHVYLDPTLQVSEMVACLGDVKNAGGDL